MRLCILCCGTGGSRLLKGLKDHSLRKQCEVSVVVNSTDNGGHSGKLRQQDKDLIAVGDFRKILSAASLNKNLAIQWESRNRLGMSIGNNALFQKYLEFERDFGLVATWANKQLMTFADIQPAILTAADITARYIDESIVQGEWQIIDNVNNNAISQLFLSPATVANPQAISSITEADVILLSPGAIHTGIISILLAQGVKQAVVESKADIIYIANLMSFPGGTNGMTGMDQVNLIEQYLGKPINIVLANNGLIPKVLIDHYAQPEYNSHPVNWPNIDDRVKFVDFIPNNIEESIDQLKVELERIGNFTKWTHLLQHDPLKTIDQLENILT